MFRVLGTVGVKALSLTSRKQGGEGLYCASLLFKSLARVSVGAFLLRRKGQILQNDKILRKTGFAISAMQMKSRGFAHAVVQAAILLDPPWRSGTDSEYPGTLDPLSAV